MIKTYEELEEFFKTGKSVLYSLYSINNHNAVIEIQGMLKIRNYVGSFYYSDRVNHFTVSENSFRYPETSYEQNKILPIRIIENGIKLFYKTGYSIYKLNGN